MVALGVLSSMPGSPFHFDTASTTVEAAGLEGAHHWALILPTSSRVPQQIYEAIIAIQYPMLCRDADNDQWVIGTGTRPTDYNHPTGLKYIHWTHQKPSKQRVDNEEGDTARKPDEIISTRACKEVWQAVMRQIDGLSPHSQTSEKEGNATFGLLALTNRTGLRRNLRGARPVPKKPNGYPVPCRVDNVVTLAGATCHTALCFQTGILLEWQLTIGSHTSGHVLDLVEYKLSAQ